MKTKSVKGFTLVELIVVIAIIGVLAAILVPSMLGYVKKAKFTSVNSTAKTLLDAAMTACRETEIVKPIPEGIYSYDGNPDGAIYDETICNYLYQYFADIKGTCWAVKIEMDCPVAACYQKVVGDAYLGTYPYANSEQQNSTDFSAFLEFAKTGEW